MNLEFKTYCGVSYIVPEGFVFDYTNISAYKDY